MNHTPKKMTRKELLKEPDQFITFSGRLIAFGQRYGRQLTYGVVALLVVLAGYTAVRYFIARAEHRALDLLDRYSAEYRLALAAKGPQAALEAVEAGLASLVDDYGRRSAGRMARIRYADLCYAAGRYEKASELYTQAMADLGQEPFYRALVLNGLGQAHWQHGDLDRAVTAFGQIADIANAPLRAQALFAMADLYTALGQSEKSQDAYRRLVDEFPDSDLARVARQFAGGV
jgi:tetratricopeptide (TPR) repeat protein